jgi:hypothetical protein
MNVERKRAPFADGELSFPRSRVKWLSAEEMRSIEGYFSLGEDLHYLLQQTFVCPFAKFIATHACHPGCIYFFNRGTSLSTDMD